MATDRERILVIRLGALGDLVFCFQSFQDIRRAHPDADIALLTRAPFAAFAASMPWFNKVIVESHPGLADIGAWARLLREIKTFAPTRIYDLQGKTRQSVLYALLGGPLGAPWSGAAPLCKFPRVWPPKPAMHFTDFLAAQLRIAGVPASGAMDVTWLDAPMDKFLLPPRYVVFIPGCSPAATYKRWPPHNYAELANRLWAQGLTVVLVGTKDDAEAAAMLKAGAPQCVDLCGKTNLYELAAVLRRAVGVIGNDTGPLHMAAAVGASTVALFSGRSNPIWSKPPGKKVVWVQSDRLDDLAVADVAAAFKNVV